MGFCGSVLGADEVFVEVGAADAGPGVFDLHPARAERGDGDVVEADVFVAVEAEGAHC